jgi:cell division transport system permease protein
MKSLKNHLSLIIALITVLLTIQISIVVERSIAAYEENLKNDYSIIVVVKKSLDNAVFLQIDRAIQSAEEITPDHVIDTFKNEMKDRNIELLKLTLPKFYRIRLRHYPAPDEIERVSAELLKHPLITRVEDFARNHDMVYKLLLLFKKVSMIFAVAIFAVTTLLILKELRIWQFQHSERMNIMALFGAPLWMRSAVLFRLAIMDAIIASLLVNGTFYMLIRYGWLQMQLETVGISVNIYILPDDALILSGVAFILSMLLAMLVIMGPKEES